MADEGHVPYRPRRALPADVDVDDADFDSDFDEADDSDFDDAADPAGAASPGHRGAGRHGGELSAETPEAATSSRHARDEEAEDDRVRAVHAASPTPTEADGPSAAPQPAVSPSPSPDAATFGRPVVESVPPPPVRPPAPASTPPVAPIPAPPSAPTFVAPAGASAGAGTEATAPAGGARRRPTLPTRGYQPRRSALSTSSAPARSAHSAPAHAIAVPASHRARVAATPGHPDPSPSPGGPNGPGGLRQRFSRQALVIGAVAAAMVAVLAVVYSVWALGDRPTTSGTPSASTPPTSATPSADEGLLPARLMLSPTQAATVLKGSTWKIVSDTEGLKEDSVTATCLARSSAAEPAAEATRIRTLAAQGEKAPAAFHQSDLYPTAADAVEAMTVRTKALGDCSTQFALLLSGAVGRNLGNSAVGVTVVVQDTPSVYHTIMINRTGRLVNVVDVATSSSDDAASVTPATVGEALAKITDRQCSFAAGLCATDPSVTTTVPPIGGDTPGLLSTADVPRVGDSTGVWTPGEPTRKPAVNTSNCEATDFSTIKNSSATLARTYILADDPGFFGFDTVLITMKSERDARELASGISDKIDDCEDRLLTATVSGKTSFEGSGLRGTTIDGTTWVVTQKIDGGKTTLRYRVGISAVGSKVVYSFANPKAKTDFTDDQWTELNVRMGQRATQVT